MAFIRSVLLLLLIAVPLFGQSVQEPFIALDFVLKVNDGTIGMSNISPRYLWLDDHSLIVPIRETIGIQNSSRPRQNVDIFFVDLLSGTAVRAVSFSEVLGVTIVPSESSETLFLAVTLEAEGVHETKSRYMLNLRTFNLESTTLEVIQEQRTAIQPGHLMPYPDALRLSSENDLYDKNINGIDYPWQQWGKYVVGLGRQVDSVWVNQMNLYNKSGLTAYILPEIQVYNDHMCNYPEVMQVSPGGRFMMLNEPQSSTLTAIALDIPVSGSLISIYGFTEEDPTQHYDTVFLDLSADNFGEGYCIGEEFPIERQIVDGSVLSAKPYK